MATEPIECWPIILHMSLSSLIHHALLIAFLCLVPGTQAALQTSGGTPAALSHWQWAAVRFQSAGALIGQNQFSEAKNELGSAAASLPEPYRNQGFEFLKQLESALNSSTNANDPGRVRQLIELCTKLGAHKAALDLSGRLAGNDVTDEPLYAWRLLETGDTKGALLAYKRKLDKEIIETWQDYYREQIRLLEQRLVAPTNTQNAIDLVRNHYLKGLETEANPFSALAELTRVLPHAQDPKQSILIYQLILKCLAALGDDPGQEAWQDQLLARHSSDPEVTASVYVDKARKAYRDKNLKQSQAFFQKVCDQYPNSNAYGDAQYGLGLVLQEQQKCDQAIQEYSKLFPSKVNDHALDSENNQDCANYRFKAALRISECYEARKDFVRALEYARMANDKYKFMSYCNDCLKQTRQNVEKRVQRLQELASKVE